MITHRGVQIAAAQPFFDNCFYVPNFVGTILHMDTATVFDEIHDGTHWADPEHLNMLNRGAVLPRQRGFWLDGHCDGDVNSPPNPVRRYKFLGFQYGSVNTPLILF